MGYEVNVDHDKCEGCEECVEVCPVDVYEIQERKSVPVNAEECLGCESCIGVCNETAITVTDTRVALSDTCLHLLKALDDVETEPESRRTDGL